MYQARVDNWRAGHLTPWVFNIDFQLPTKPFYTVPGLLPPSPFYFIFYLPQRTPSQCPFPPAPSAVPCTSPYRNHALHLLHFSTLAPLSVPSATGGVPQIGWGAKRKAVRGRGKLMSLARTYSASKHAFACNEPLPISRHECWHSWSLEQKSGKSVWNTKQAENEI